MDFTRDRDQITASTSTTYRLTRKERQEIIDEIDGLIKEYDELPSWRFLKAQKLKHRISRLFVELGED